MGTLISVVGNTGIGKTTFVSKLCRGTNYCIALEESEKRPFQEQFMHNKQQYALANQVDFLLYRAEQELDIQNSDYPAVQDGGLDQDFHIYTKLFHFNDYLSAGEFEICQRLYHLLRAKLPCPDLFIWMKASVKTIAERYDRRNRRLSIAQIEDLESMEELLENWLSKYPAEKVFAINAEHEDKNYIDEIQIVRGLIEKL